MLKVDNLQELLTCFYECNFYHEVQIDIHAHIHGKHFPVTFELSYLTFLAFVLWCNIKLCFYRKEFFLDANAKEDNCYVDITALVNFYYLIIILYYCFTFTIIPYLIFTMTWYYFPC